MALGFIASTHCRTNNASDSSKNGCNILLYREEPMGQQKIELLVVTCHFKSHAINVMGQQKIAGLVQPQQLTSNAINMMHDG